MLDISIRDVRRVPKIEKLIQNQKVIITEKVDGIKLTLIRNNSPWSHDPADNWIVAYKSSIIHREDFDGIDSKVESQVRSTSHGYSQYKFVWDMLEEANQRLKNIPPNTEFFFEYQMRKATLTRRYESYHHLILLAHSPTQYIVNRGRILSTPSTFDTTDLTKLAADFGVLSPKVLFHGMLSGIENLENDFLGIQSQFGGAIEGIVLTFDSGEIYKLTQSDQHDFHTRQSLKKQLYPKNQKNYWEEVWMTAESVVNSIDLELPLQQMLSEISRKVYNGPQLIFDANKPSICAMDDVFFTAKRMLFHWMKGNSGALFLGRFSPLTIAHHKIISDALDRYDTVTINIVKSGINSRNPFPIDLQMKMIQQCFGDRVEVTKSISGNLRTIIPKSVNVIGTVLAGSDRVGAYKSQVKDNFMVNVVEIPREDEISGTMARECILNDNQLGFQQLTPPCIHSMYGELRSHVISTAS